MSTPISHLSEISACSEAVAWVKSTKCRSLESAWKKCERGDWMLWYAAKKAGPVGDKRRKRLVLAACECARLSLPVWEKRYPDDKRVSECIETAEKWAKNEATLEALRVSRQNCYDAAYAVATNNINDASDATSAYAAASADAASSADYVSYTCAADAVSAASADDASYAAYAAYARTASLKKCADIVRKHYPTLPT